MRRLTVVAPLGLPLPKASGAQAQICVPPALVPYFGVPRWLES